MNNLSVRYILILVCGGALGLLVTFSVFSGEANKIGGLFRYIAIVAFLIALARPTAGILILIISSGYLDMFKRFTTLDVNVSALDIGIVLAFAPVLVGGITLNFVVMWFVRPSNDISKQEKIIFVCCMAWAGLSALPLILGGGGIRSAGHALNFFVYPFLLMAAPRFFSDVNYTRKCLVTLCISYMPVMALGIHEAFYGYNDITMDYLLAGYSQEIRQLYDAQPGSMSTLSGPPALSIMMAIIGGILLVPFDFNGRFRIFRLSNIVCWPLAIGCFMAAYYSFARTGWVVGIGFFVIVTVLIIRKKWVFYSFGMMSVSGIAILYLSASYLLEIDAMRVLQDKMRGKSADAVVSQKTTLATFNGRLESMKQVMEDGTIWTPFGMRVAGISTEGYSTHEIVGSMLLKYGYVTMMIVGFLGLFTYFRVGRINFNMGNSPTSNLMRICLAMALACFITVIGHGQTVFAYPINFLWGLSLAMAIGLMRNVRLEQKSYNTVEQIEHSKDTETGYGQLNWTRNENGAMSNRKNFSPLKNR